MKRVEICAAAVLVATAPLAAESEEMACKDRPCVNEVVAPQPEHPHSHEEISTQQVLVEMIGIPSSPPVSAMRARTTREQLVREFGEEETQSIEKSRYFICLPAGTILTPFTNWS